MRLKISIGKYIIYCILTSIIVCIFAYAFMDFMKFKMDFKLVVAVAFFTNIMLYILFSYPKSAAAVTALISMVFTALFLIKRDMLKEYASIIIKTMEDCTKWFLEYLYSSNGSLIVSYSNAVSIACIVLTTSLIFLLVIVLRRIMLTITAGVTVLGFLWFFGFSGSFKYIQLFLFVSFMLISFVQYDYKETAWKFEHGLYSKNISIIWMGYALGFTMLVFFLTCFLPNEIKPLNNKWLNDNVYSVLNEYVFYNSGIEANSDSNAKVFSISSFGFQEKSSKLGGPVVLSDRTLLKVKTDGNIKTPFYLRGSIKDTYTGLLWAKSETLTQSLNSGDAIPDLYGNYSSIKNSEDVTVTVYPQSINTITIFNLWKPYKVEINSGVYNFDNNGEITLPGTRMKDKVYKVESKVPVIYSDELIHASSYARNVARYLRPYLQLPNELPDRVKALAVKITDKYNTNFEKAMAIQDYLRNNYPYSLSTKAVPDGRDFVDYFLFDEKKGYCTYYASAMVVLSRILRIPSRYVEGFIVEDKDLESNGLYNVKASKAHAWAELYFDGYGWVRFEPTASYLAADYTRPKETDLNAYIPAENNAPVNLPVPEAKDQKQLEDNSIPAVADKKGLSVYIYVEIAILLFLVFRILMKAIIGAICIKKADSLKGKDAVMEYLNIFEKKLRLGGIERNADETPLEFADRIKEMMLDYNINIVGLIDSFNRIRFGNCEMEDSDRKNFNDAIKTADRIIKNHNGLFKYLLIKYIL